MLGNPYLQTSLIYHALIFDRVAPAPHNLHSGARLSYYHSQLSPSRHTSAVVNIIYSRISVRGPKRGQLPPSLSPSPSPFPPLHHRHCTMAPSLLDIAVPIQPVSPSWGGSTRPASGLYVTRGTSHSMERPHSGSVTPPLACMHFVAWLNTVIIIGESTITNRGNYSSSPSN